MQYGRLLSFTILVLFGGLLQIWALLFILNLKEYRINVGEVLGDGGLFFFTTSLIIGSAITLYEYNPIKLGSIDFNISLIVFIIIFLPALFRYVVVLSGGGLTDSNPFSGFVFDQIAFASAAFGYWFFTGLRTGLFVEKRS